MHTPSQSPVAIKRITPFYDRLFAQRTLREIKLLKHFQWVCAQGVDLTRRHENIIAILDSIPPPRHWQELEEVYLVQVGYVLDGR